MRLLTYKEAAEILTISDSAIRRIPKSELPRIKMGYKNVRIAEPDLYKYIEKKRVKA